MGAVYTVFALAYFTFNMGAMLKGAGKLVSVASGDVITPNAVVLAMTGTFLIYSFVGGLVSAAYTDFVQSFFIIALSFLLIPLGLREVGGFAESAKRSIRKCSRWSLRATSAFLPSSC